MRRDWVASLLACVVTLSAFGLGMFEPFERPLIDLRMRLLERPADPQLVLIEIDPQSIHEVGSWPWPRSVHALLLDRLTAADAGSVFLDVDFSLASREGEDAALERALERRQERTVLPVFRQWSESAEAYVDVGPLPRFTRHATVASTNMVPAGDGLVREVSLTYPWRGRELQSMAAVIAGLPPSARGVFSIDYGIDLTSIPRFSFVDVARGDIDPAVFRDRTVLIGATAIELGDVLSVPRHRILPGPVVLALAAQSLTLDRALSRVPFLILCLAVAAFVLLLDWSLRNRTLKTGFAVVFGANAAVWAMGFGVQAFYPVIVDLVPFAFGSFGAGVTAVALRFQETATNLVSENLMRRRTENFMGVVAQNAFDALVTVDQDGWVKFINVAASQMFGVRLSQGNGLHIASFCVRPRGLDVDGTAAALHRVLDGGRHRRIICRRSNGELFYADLAVSELADRSEPMFILLLRDIDRRVRAERRLLARENDLRRAKAVAESANQTKTEFLANMSHELKTPLNAIIGFSEIMEHQLHGPLGKEEYVGYCRDIRESGQRLFALVSDVLEFSRTEAEDADLREDDFDLVALCNRIAEHFSLRLSGDPLQFFARLPPGEAYYRADERLIRLAITNVIDNAIKFTPSGGEITFSLMFEEDGSTRILVEDNGIGIEASEIENCFEAFKQADRGLNRSHEGAGLGLTLSKRFIELHQGQIALESQVDVGTRVSITVPTERFRGRVMQESA